MLKLIFLHINIVAMFFFRPTYLLTIFVIAAALLPAAITALEVKVDTKKAGSGPSVTKAHKYSAHVTLYIEDEDGSRTPSGWSTRKEDGAAADQPFEFQPGVNLIEGWSEGVLQMVEGERADLHVPADKGYGDRPMGAPGGAFYIPAKSNL